MSDIQPKSDLINSIVVAVESLVAFLVATGLYMLGTASLVFKGKAGDDVANSLTVSIIGGLCYVLSNPTRIYFPSVRPQMKIDRFRRVMIASVVGSFAVFTLSPSILSFFLTFMTILSVLDNVFDRINQAERRDI